MLGNTYQNSPTLNPGWISDISYDGYGEIENAWHDGLKPDPQLLVSEWADEHRVLPAKSSDEAGKWRTSRTPYLKEIMDELSPSSPTEKVTFMKGAQIGGPLCLNTPIPTVDGWTTMGDVKVGDWVFDEKGKPCRVNYVSPIYHNRDCYEITFQDGERIVADSVHKWPLTAYENYKKPVKRMVKTEEMFGKVKTPTGKYYRFSSEVTPPIELPDKEFLIHPYVLGLWLGDGNAIMNHISVHDDDAIIADLIKDCRYTALFRRPAWRKGKCANIVINPSRPLAEEFDYDFSGNKRPNTTSFLKALEYLNVLGNKHIPADYFRGSISQRLALIQGLMDSDGNITKNGRCEFSNTNHRIKNGMLHLLNTLGLKVSKYKTQIKKRVFAKGCISDCKASWRLSWVAYDDMPMFRLPRKLERMKPASAGRANEVRSRRIQSIEKVASRPVRCIEVSAKSHLFLCGFSFIPTHNTEAGNNFLGFIIHMAPGPALAVSPTVELAKRNSRQRIETLIEDCPELRKRVASPKSRDSGNTILSKSYPGGMLVLTGANSAVGLRSMSCRYLFLDELDGWPSGDLDGEGDPQQLVERRTATFRRRRKILIVSTPTEKSTSRVLREFLDGDQRYYFVPCPHCGHKQKLVFANFKWEEGKPQTVHYVCEKCEEKIHEHHKTEMLRNGEWIPTAKTKYRNNKSYHLSSLYSPVGWYSWEDAVIDYEKALKDKDRMKSFINTVLGEAYEDEFDAPEWERLYERRDDYTMGVVPHDGLFLTCGVDFQKDRAECEVVAWTRNKISYSVDYFVLQGDTAKPEVWKKLNKILEKDWPHARGGTMPIRVMCVDSGYATQDVYSYVKNHPQAVWGAAGARASQPRTVVAIKGRDNDTALICNVSKADAGGKRQGIKVWSIGTPVAKTELYRWLKLPRLTDEQSQDGEETPAGSCFFPQYGEEYFKQLTAEKRVTRFVKGFPKAVWEKEPTRNNEALDCRVYARAAASIYGLDRFRELHWRRLEKVLGEIQDKPKNKSKTNTKKKKALPFYQRNVTASDDPYL